MKKTKLTLLALVLSSSLIVGTTTIQAENETETESEPTSIPQNRNAFRKEIEEKRETVQEERQERIEERKEKREEVKATITERAQNRQEHRSEVAKQHAENLQKRFENHYTRLSNIASRIQTRLNTLEEKGEDVSTAQAKLDTANALLQQAQTLGDEAVKGFETIDPQKYEEQRELALAARDKAGKARQAYVDAMQSMKDALLALKKQ